MTASVTGSPTRRAAAAPPLHVDPEILAIAKDVARPRAFVPFSRALDHLPGRGGLVEGVSTAVGMRLRGERFLSDLAKKNGPVFQSMFGPMPVVFVADADLVWSILRNEERLWSSALVWRYYFGDLMPGDTGDGTLMLDFDFHRDARRLLQPAFSAQAIAGYLDDANALYERAIDEWLRRGHVSFKREVRALLARVSAKIFMGIDDERESERMDRLMNDGWGAVIALMKRSRFSWHWGRAERGLDTLWKSLRPRMDERRSGGKDLLSRICQTRDDADWLDDDTRMKIFISTMFGAFDTTASGLASMGYLLARNPIWQERLRREAAGSSSTPDGLRTLEEHEWVWKESLRLYPVAGQSSRLSLRETELGGFPIPAAAHVVVMSGTLANDPKWWTAPQRFDPERFSPARAEDKRHKATFLPFGAGAHACVGAQVANVEVKAFWHAMLRRCRFRLARDYEARHGYTPLGTLSGDIDLVVERL
jgi:cytochrome P450